VTAPAPRQAGDDHGRRHELGPGESSSGAHDGSV
jgi:hypothetical protein